MQSWADYRQIAHPIWFLLTNTWQFTSWWYMSTLFIDVHKISCGFCNIDRTISLVSRSCTFASYFVLSLMHRLGTHWFWMLNNSFCWSLILFSFSVCDVIKDHDFESCKVDLYSVEKRTRNFKVWAQVETRPRKVPSILSFKLQRGRKIGEI